MEPITTEAPLPGRADDSTSCVYVQFRCTSELAYAMASNHRKGPARYTLNTVMRAILGSNVGLNFDLFFLVWAK